MKKYIKSFNELNRMSINEELSVADIFNNLDLSNRGLTSLEGSPEKTKKFNMSHNQLKNLIGGPKYVNAYYAHDNQLQSLNGVPEEVDTFEASRNILKNLIGGPKIAKYYYVYSNKLKTLE